MKLPHQCGRWHPHQRGSFWPICRSRADTVPLLFLLLLSCCFLDIYNVAVEGVPRMAEIRRSLPPEDEAWRRQWTFPYEDRLTLTTAPWRGERRWFRSANVIPLERYRTDEEWRRICGVFWPPRYR
jgi:hypothetical protein